MKRYFSMTYGRPTVLMGLLALAVCMTAGVVAKDATSPPKVTVSDKPVDRTGRVVSFAPVVKKVSPSVVSVLSTRTVKFRSWNPFSEDPFFQRFFGGNDSRGTQPQTRQERGLGSGVIISEDGYILTNNHVVEGADKDGIKVALADEKNEYTAKVVGTDPQTDVAVLKIEASKLTPITLGDSDQLEVGDVVLAVGNPFGLLHSVTMGIVSALGRDSGGMILGQRGYEDFIQTDAPINVGNSGGALVDAEGRLVGISQSILSGGSGANAGVGFAIPINLARTIMDRLVTDGKVARGYLGVSIQPVTADLSKAFDLPDENGALVGGVQPGTPAAKAGLKAGDVIIELNGKKVTDSRHFRLMVAQTPPRSKVNLKLLRDGKEKTLTATLGTLPSELGGVGGEEPAQLEPSKTDALDGVEVADLDSRARRQSNIPSEVEGALITKVESGSPAEAAGLKPGDVIIEIEKKPVANADEAVELSEKVKGDRVLLRVWSSRGGPGGMQYVIVDKSKAK
jgi:serine protease Do